MFAPKEFPVWYQGLVYFLSPRHAGELFHTALNTHYMHTDDVFVGICVNNTNSVRPHRTAVKHLSEFAMEGFDLIKSLQPKWLHGNAKFFHIPNIELYYTWSLADLRTVSMPEVPWFQW